jgi:hypothetical protein
VVVIPTEGRDLWVAEKEGMGEEQGSSVLIIHNSLTSMSIDPSRMTRLESVLATESPTAVPIRSLPSVGMTSKLYYRQNDAF